MNKTGDVTPDGRYITPYKDPNKRFGAQLGALSGGRVGITGMALTNLRAALVIAVRYKTVFLGLLEIELFSHAVLGSFSYRKA